MVRQINGKRPGAVEPERGRFVGPLGAAMPRKKEKTTKSKNSNRSGGLETKLPIYMGCEAQTGPLNVGPEGAGTPTKQKREVNSKFLTVVKPKQGATTRDS